MSDSDAFEIKCPCCGAMMSVSSALKSVLHHAPPPERKAAADFDAAVAGVERAKDEAERKFAENLEAERTKKQRLNAQFDDLFGKAQSGELPAAGPRDVDLD